MSIQTDLESRAAKLRDILGRINEKLTGKGANSAPDLDSVPDAIDTISGGSNQKTVSIDYSDYSDGKFYETLDTGKTVTYNLTLDSGSKPTKITDDSGHVVTVNW